MIYTPPHLYDSPRWSGLRIGLLGGSFNPPHEGHVHISHVARTMLNLDAVWWLVTPQNPFKAGKSLAPYDERLDACRAMTGAHPHLIVSDLERQMGVNRSYDTLKALRPHFPQTDFVWITGMDNAQNFHKWYRWKDILALVPTAHVARPPSCSLIEHAPFKALSTHRHVFVDRALRAPLNPGVTYWILQKKMLNISSTQIRTYGKA